MSNNKLITNVLLCGALLMTSVVPAMSVSGTAQADSTDSTRMVQADPLADHMDFDFYDFNTREKVGDLQVNISKGEEKYLTTDDIPNGYFFFNSDGKKTELIWTIKGRPGATETVYLIKSSKDDSLAKNSFKRYGYISTKTDQGPIQLVNSEGKVSNRMLGPNTDWAFDKTCTYKKNVYFRVSTDEWVKASDVYQYFGIHEIATVKPDRSAKVVSVDGQTIGGTTLTSNSVWLVDKLAYINGKQHFRVSTNTWVSADDFTSKILY